MKDIILHVRDNEKILNISRKTCKNLFLYGVNPNLAQNDTEKLKIEAIREKLKKEFDEKLWPH